MTAAALGKDNEHIMLMHNGALSQCMLAFDANDKCRFATTMMVSTSGFLVNRIINAFELKIVVNKNPLA